MSMLVRESEVDHEALFNATTEEEREKALDQIDAAMVTLHALKNMVGPGQSHEAYRALWLAYNAVSCANENEPE